MPNGPKRPVGPAGIARRPARRAARPSSGRSRRARSRHGSCRPPAWSRAGRRSVSPTVPNDGDRVRMVARRRTLDRPAGVTTRGATDRSGARGCRGRHVGALAPAARLPAPASAAVRGRHRRPAGEHACRAAAAAGHRRPGRRGEWYRRHREPRPGDGAAGRCSRWCWRWRGSCRVTCWASSGSGSWPACGRSSTRGWSRCPWSSTSADASASSISRLSSDVTQVRTMLTQTLTSLLIVARRPRGCGHHPAAGEPDAAGPGAGDGAGAHRRGGRSSGGRSSGSAPRSRMRSRPAPRPRRRRWAASAWSRASCARTWSSSATTRTCGAWWAWRPGSSRGAASSAPR